MSLRPLARKLLIAAPVVLLVIQLIPVDRTNPPVETDVPAPADVREVLRRACYDCHSNETVWPWYSRVAPVSWVVAWDVHNGRRHLNFSTWNRLTPDEQREALEEIWEEVESGSMPLGIYLPAHPQARLTDRDKARIERWTREASSGAGPDSSDEDER